jgi:hypothetical protein
MAKGKIYDFPHYAITMTPLFFPLGQNSLLSTLTSSYVPFCPFVVL